MLKRIRLFLLKILGGVDKSEINKVIAKYRGNKVDTSILSVDVKPVIHKATLDIAPNFLASLTEDEAKDYVYNTILDILKGELVDELEVIQTEDHITQSIKFKGTLRVLPCQK